jgi:oligoendopeptidase F
MDRTGVPETDQWNVKAIYPSLEDWKKEFTKVQGNPQGSPQAPHWPVLARFKGRLNEGPAVVLQLVEAVLDLDKNLSKLYTYAHLRHDEDVGHDVHKEAYLRIVGLLHDFRQETCWIEPELLSLSDGDLMKLLNAPDLKPYKFYLEKIIRLKPHTLDAEKEEMLASASLALDASERAFGAFNNADLKFPNVKDSAGQEHELTHGKYSVYMRSHDRVLRKNTFLALHNSFGAFENTLCELINGQVQKDYFNAKVRHFSSCLEAALFPHNIDKKVYMNLISTVRKHLPVLHRYMEFRKQALKVDELHLYDMSVPLVADADIKMEFEEAAKFIVESMAPLGAGYQKSMEKGFFEDRWVDRYENQRKRSGAYSSGCFGTMPYILMNYFGEYNSITTLAHEAGHSMHSFSSWKSQPYQDAGYPIFVAEVASTFNEELLLRHFRAAVQDPQKIAYLVNQGLEGIRNTFFRQVMFAEFELKIHEFAEKSIPLTPLLLKTEYRKLVSDYFGPAVTLDDEVDIEWARIPHFYYNFYVYQYATGIAAAHALVETVVKNGPEKYLKFLSSGGSRFPLDLLEIAGVDMRSPAALEAIIAHFGALTEDLKKTLNKTSVEKTASPVH